MTIQTELFHEGRALRDKGIKQVSEHNLTWMEQCIEAFPFFKMIMMIRNEDFTGEDIRNYCEIVVSFPTPTHSNAWGALINTLLKRKIIQKTGEYRPMKLKSSHARSTPVYKAV